MDPGELRADLLPGHLHQRAGELDGCRAQPTDHKAGVERDCLGQTVLTVGTGQASYLWVALEPHAPCKSMICPARYCSCNFDAGPGGDQAAFDTLLYAPLLLR